ncbi:flagellar brake protein [Anaerosinus massiliensis]|uniref:flagellar brake protein n=1 Tax=Massilibacillus massiliensis TaxID=1806837 RepID=UPI000DA62AB4|nr:flagellar brake domain-containing protein [Massilibacillus massiliensis]
MVDRQKFLPSGILEIGQCVEVSVTTDTENHKYTSRIEEYDSQNLILAMPMVKGYPIIPMFGSDVCVRFVKNQTSYRFTSVYIDKKAGAVPVWIIKMPEDIEKVQLREFVRVDALLPLKVQLEDEKHNLLPPISCYIKDVSGGGVQLVMKQIVQPGQKIYIDAQFPEVGNLQTYCEVVRAIEVNKSDKIFWIGTKFVDLSEAIRTKLIRFIFKRQRELLQKQR